MADDARICVGAIAGAYGVRGEVRLKSFCATPADIATYGRLMTEDGGREFAMTGLHPIAGGLAARLSGVETREEGEALRGTRLYVRRSQLPAPADEEFYHADLIGLMVQDTAGRMLGRVIAVQNHGAGDILEIRPEPGGGDTLLLPFTRESVPTIDLARGLLIALPPHEIGEAPGHD